MLNITFTAGAVGAGASAALRYVSGSTKMMLLFAVPCGSGSATLIAIATF
jgi:hypothetical protein